MSSCDDTEVKQYKYPFVDPPVGGGFLTLEQKEANARARKCTVIVPADDELQIDIDSEDELAEFTAKIHKKNVIGLIGPFTIDIAPSASGKPGRCHVTVTLSREVDDCERIFLQALLGSDPVRELLSWKRLQNGDPHPSVFFNPEAT